ncbi:tetratricopeptide repeat protein [Shewanella acanthi]|uniref:tetratricopeptide repeat protein n=1 Tax=Shewanella acanthi TaxID=2864212 RepID=UPI001C65C810|nr:tetratricopeptide repeat protein [Shewanella acanthi]QYJ79322.1 SEL1-like repeat protein [Shewanella acanthi]
MKYRHWVLSVGLSFSLGLSLGLSSAAHAFSIPQPANEVAASKFAVIQVQAMQGEAEAQFLLGLMYLTGRYVAQEVPTGIHWMTLAAEQQHEKAQQTLGDLSFEGQLIKRDLATAERWYKTMAENGSHWAQFRLGFIYASGGDGVVRDCGKAVEQFIQVGDDVALGNVAWILATCPEAKYRDGNRALELSLQLLKENENDPTHLDNLAAAYAEVGDFGSAVSTQQKAIAVLKSQQQDTKADEFILRLQSYEQKRAYRETVRLDD